MKLRHFFVSCAIASIAASAFAADKNSFVLVSTSNGKTIGKASYSIEKAKDAFKVHAEFEFRMSSALMPKRTDPAPSPGRDKPYRPAMMLEGQYAGEYKVDAQGNFLTGYLQDPARSSILSYTPNKARNDVTIGETQAGSVNDTHDIQIPSPNFLFLPSFDPSAVQVLMNTALGHPGNKDPYLLLVPEGAMGGDQLLYVTVAPANDTRTGTLDGKPVALKHYSLLFHAGRAEVFVDESGALMDAQISLLGVDYIRSKFVLTP